LYSPATAGEFIFYFFLFFIFLENGVTANILEERVFDAICLLSRPAGSEAAGSEAHGSEDARLRASPSRLSFLFLCLSA
jgi:hypothetical protein